MDVPALGIGTARFDSNDRCRRAVETALDVGYRRIDTAQMYGAEGAVGEAVAAAVDRDGLFVTRKLDDGNRDHDAVRDQGSDIERARPATRVRPSTDGCLPVLPVPFSQIPGPAPSTRSNPLEHPFCH